MRPLVAAALLALAPGAALAADLIGPETCKACHPAAYEAWRVSPHARALEAVPEARRKDARCTTCHAPDLDKGAASVSCETCHGPGRLYAHAYVMRDRELSRAVGLVDPGEKSCLACHTESAPSLHRFEYAKKLPLIDHWTADRAERAARASAPPAAPVPVPAPAPAPARR
ncbi:MAG TPA: multiheme c-type cytochrome [Anaeromyxobacteraceae bacterium]|nr:multiheme c-type cytochrome [Anaeromyxobacteraceae bacterium]